MKQSQFYYLLRRGLFSAGSAIIKNGLVMFNKFTTAGLNFPAQGSASFDGSSDYIQIKDDGKGSAFETQTFTISAWVNAKTLGDNIIWSYDFTSHAGQPYYAQQFRLLSGGNIYFGWNNNGALQDLQTSGGGFYSVNDWVHIAVTFENNSQKMYVDGSQVASASSTATITYYNQEVWIGKGNFAGDFDGNMANVAFWNRALSSDEINSVMWKSYEGLEGAESNGLQAWYKLDESELFDASNTSTTNLEEYARLNSVTFEGKDCLQTALNALPDITDARLYSAKYDIRVSGDGGTVEALNCVETELNALL